MQLDLPIIGTTCRIRPFEPTDAAEIARHGNDRQIWLNLRDAFPYPYRIEDAHKFIEFACGQERMTHFCIADMNDRAVGCIGYALKNDVERFSAEMGYWIGREFWNRGIVTEAVKRITELAFQQHQLIRIFATPYAWNRASTRVLEKAGYRYEGRLQSAAVKDGIVVDLLLYAVVSTKPAEQLSFTTLIPPAE